MRNQTNFAIAGEAGQGIETAADITAKIIHQAGINVYTTTEYMSRVRGGSNTVFVKVSDEKSPYFSDKIDILLMLDEKARDHLKNFITPDTIIVEAPKNTYAIGYIAGLLGIENPDLQTQFPKIFTKEENINAFNNGQSAANTKIEIVKDEALANERIFTGNQALGFGAIAGGANFLAFYPMSPGTHFAEFLIKHSDDFNIVTFQAEDEICAMNMAIGASYAGARSCVTTAGGGFSLMCEGISLAGATETPVVIHIGQRPGPATGLPTRTAQEDLNLALYSGQGEFPRIILSPATLEDSFTIGAKAFDLAQKYQVPVFILSEKDLLECSYAANIVVDSVQLNSFTPKIPGENELVRLDSDEHDEDGYITEDFEVRKRMVEKRLKKFDLIEIIPPYFVGPENYECLIISWGSNFNVIKAAIETRERFALLHYTQLYPFSMPDAKGKKIIIEQNATAQFANLLGLEFDHKLLKYDGMPFSIEEVERFLDEI